MKRKIQDEDEAEETPKKKFKVEEDISMIVEDEKKNHQNENQNCDAVYEKEVRSLPSLNIERPVLM